MIALAIDIGLTGALASVDPYGAAKVVDLPTLPDGKTRRLDGRALLIAIRAMVPPGDHAVMVFEDVRARPAGNGGKHGNTMHSQASMFGSRRVVEAICDIARIEMEAVQPATWKRVFKLIRLKDETPRACKERGRQMALTLYPSLAADLRLKDHHNRADAVLMAHWLRGKRC